jgi:hypothetical protein
MPSPTAWIAGMSSCPARDRAAFDPYRLAMIADHQPLGAEEQDCVERMVAAQWRTQRIWRAEGQIHAQASRRLGFQADAGTAILFDAQNEKALAYLDRKEASLTREYHRSSRRLQELQDLRRKGMRHVIEDDTPEQTTAAETPSAGAFASSDGGIAEITEQSQAVVDAMQNGTAAAPVEGASPSAAASGEIAEQSQLDAGASAAA